LWCFGITFPLHFPPIPSPVLGLAFFFFSSPFADHPSDRASAFGYHSSGQSMVGFEPGVPFALAGTSVFCFRSADFTPDALAGLSGPGLQVPRCFGTFRFLYFSLAVKRRIQLAIFTLLLLLAVFLFWLVRATCAFGLFKDPL